ncbi:mandelate racemase/muconate lactonizing enzyme family protein [Allopusillimonas ginsengisoli]|uniref:mandelate racemase/muconate lactonizing enzyme family protein n=1 Tax=Allopusillimonas ginsengisoli TaxID=453575 RepID=UPI001430D69A|nr:mandelate racemase/muconate lactonizing enzyme family protein [Allopusillimonas ginsengisoli]
MTIQEVVLRRLNAPLKQPYVVSTRAIHAFDPIVVCIRNDDGGHGWGEALIAPGYTAETVEDSWQFCRGAAMAMLGERPAAAKDMLLDAASRHPGGASAMLSALDMMEEAPILRIDENLRIPLLAPVNAHEPAAMRQEIEQLLAAGYRTLKIKIGFDWQQDLARIEKIQQIVRGRAMLRLDANRGYDLGAGKAVASRLHPEGIELFEQPCGSDEWAAHAEIGMCSTVPLMLDESIYSIEDIARCGPLEGVGFVKLKLKKVGSPGMLVNALQYIRDQGMEPVLGDGVATDIACWAEACVATRCIRNAGEMNGYLKLGRSLFKNPLCVEEGEMVIPKGYWPQVDDAALDAVTVIRDVLTAQ